jgi:hypothetical protein
MEYTDSDYPFGVFKLFLCVRSYIMDWTFGSIHRFIY